jgi:beta-glucosidase
VAALPSTEKVCAAMKCAVLVVSGRPLDITGIVPEADAVIASWLPGSEGEGVADTLFGLKPFTGRLPVTWFKAESQIPINVGDKNYDPLFPYGWGLQTGSQKDSVGRAQALAEQAITTPAQMSATAALTANAEHDLVAGDTVQAVQQFVKARSLALEIGG